MTDTRLRDRIEEPELSRKSRDRPSSCHQVRAGTRRSFPMRRRSRLQPV